MVAKQVVGQKRGGGVKKNDLLVCLMSVFLGVSYARPAVGEAAANENSSPKISKSLEINRSMVARFEAQQTDLNKKRVKNPSAVSERDLENLNYKIQALHEDAARLRASLPKSAGISSKSVTADDEINEMHERALEVAGQNNFKKALELYEEIVLKNPEDDQAYLIMGHIYLMSGEYERSESAFQNAVHIDRDNRDEIAPFYENKILQNPDDDVAYANLGYAYLILGDTLKAQSAFKNALSINPYNQIAMNGLKLIAARKN